MSTSEDTVYAYEFTVPRPAWRWDADGLIPFLIRRAQEKAGTSEGEWVVHDPQEDLSPMLDGLDPVYRVMVEGRIKSE